MAMMDEPSQARLESDRSPDGDAVQFLLLEHDKIMGLLEQLRGCGGGAEGSRRELWHQIIREAATHEEAEDQVVYPTVRPALADMLAAHARNEEEQVFSLLKTLDAGKLAQMGDALRGAKAIAPTRPHPAAPNTPRATWPRACPQGWSTGHATLSALSRTSSTRTTRRRPRPPADSEARNERRPFGPARR